MPKPTRHPYYNAQHPNSPQGISLPVALEPTHMQIIPFPHTSPSWKNELTNDQLTTDQLTSAIFRAALVLIDPAPRTPCWPECADFILPRIRHGKALIFIFGLEATTCANYALEFRVLSPVHAAWDVRLDTVSGW